MVVSNNQGGYRRATYVNLIVCSTMTIRNSFMINKAKTYSGTDEFVQNANESEKKDGDSIAALIGNLIGRKVN